MTTTKSEAELKIEAVVTELGITMACEFVPFSQSRKAKPNAKLNELSLNWRVTLARNGRDFITTDYSSGIAHCPSYKQGKLHADDKAVIRKECQTGKASRYLPNCDIVVENRIGDNRILPKLADVISSLVSDSEALDSPAFDDWASNYGYDADSRKAESIYRACLETSLKLRAAIGESGLSQLRDACQDY